MTAPRHLWSGDWELESSAHADDLASRRGRNTTPDDPEPAEPKPPDRREPRENPIRRALRTLREGLRGVNRRRVRVALLTTFLVLLGATAAYAVISNSTSSNTTTQTVVENSGSQPWLGVKLANAPVRGALVSAVVPGSPAAQAGIKPGDLITQLDTQPIVAPAVLTSAIDGLQPGNTVDIQLQRGASQLTAHVRLASSPSKTP